MEAVNTNIRSLLLALTFVVAPLISSGQHNAEERDRFRLAQTFERAGDMRSAARIYQELYSANPKSDPIFQGVVRSLYGLQQYEPLLELVIEHYKGGPRPDLAITIGSLYGKLGNIPDADRWWKEARTLSGNDESVVVRIGAEQQQLLLNTQALSTYLDARKINGSALSYADEIISLRSLTGNVLEAANEAISAFEDERDQATLIRRFNMLMVSDAGIDAINKGLLRLPRNDQASLRVQLWFLRQTKQWPRAFEVAKDLESVMGGLGNEMLQFADGARIDGKYDVAIEAYRNVLTKAADKRLRVSGAYGSARALEQKLRLSSKLTKDEARTIILQYDEIIKAYSEHPISADALLNSAMLLDDVLADISGARERLMRLVNQWKGTTSALEGGLRLADIYIAMSKDQEAQALLTMLMSVSSSGVKEKLDLAVLRKADLLLWSGNSDSALSIYKTLASHLGSLAANDALDRMLLLELRQDDSVAVGRIINGHQRAARRDLLGAAEQFDSAATHATDPELRDRASIEASRYYVLLGMPDQAVRMLKPVIESVPESIFGDRALFILSEIQEQKGDSKSAIQLLTALLTNYPRSILVPEARHRIRRIRGDA